MHTNEKLAAALREIDLTTMADRAAKGWYHDFMSPLDAPTMTLANDLAVEANYADRKGKPEKRAAIWALRERVKNGDFDATNEESEAWAASPDGQETMARLNPKR